MVQCRPLRHVRSPDWPVGRAPACTDTGSPKEHSRADLLDICFILSPLMPLLEDSSESDGLRSSSRAAQRCSCPQEPVT